MGVQGRPLAFSDFEWIRRPEYVNNLALEILMGIANLNAKKRPPLGWPFRAGETLLIFYFNSASTDWLDWLACASMAVAACWMI